MKILMVLTSHGNKHGNTGGKPDFWPEEFAVPYYAFKDAGAAITLASSFADESPPDAASHAPAFQSEAARRFKADPAAQGELAGALTLRELARADFDAVFYSGSKAPVWDWPSMQPPLPD